MIRIEQLPVYLEAINTEFEKRTKPGEQPRTWNYLRDWHKNISASIYCSNGHYGILTDHTIESDGAVKPSVVCPEPGCDFHEYISLKGWNPIHSEV